MRPDLFPETALKKTLRWCGCYLSVRHRYILTKKNRLRLRVALPSAGIFVSVVLLSFSAFTSPSRAIYLHNDVIAFTNKNDIDLNLAVTQKNLKHDIPGQDQNDRLRETERFASAIAQETALLPREETLQVGKGDTLAGVLQKIGVSAGEAYKAVLAMEKYYDPRKIRPGQEIQVRFDPVEDDDHSYQFSQMKLEIDPLTAVSLNRTAENGFESTLLEKEAVTQTYAARAVIDVSLYGATYQAGIPASVAAQALRVFSWDVDFQRDIRKGDALEVMYEQLETPEGVYVKSGDVIYARLIVNGQDMPIYRFETADGDTDFYTDKGASIRKALLQTPIDGARISSGFGMRQHPVMGYSKMHKGIDFAAARGTPIYAAGDGTVEKAGPYSSFGNYVRIRHNAGLKTAYAHLNGFAKGMSAGSRVKQGQVIGYVGTTGRSTGPHLHYEVLQDNRQVNPKSIKMQQGKVLAGKELENFKSRVAEVNRRYTALTKGTKVASRQVERESALR